MHRKLYHVREDEAETDKFHDDADGKEARHGMPLPTHRVDLQGDEHCVDEDEDEIHLERVLLVVGELERQRDKGRLIRIAVHQTEVVRNVRHTGHVEATWVEVVPLTGGGVAVTCHQGDVPESGDGELIRFVCILDGLLRSIFVAGDRKRSCYRVNQIRRTVINRLGDYS